MSQQPQPKRGAAFTVVFPILDADGDLVTGAAGLDSEISKDLGTFEDCTNEATEIATSSGMYYLTLTAGEMTADIVSIIVKTSTEGAKTTPIVLYPATRDSNDLAYPATSGRSLAVDASGNVAGDLKLWLGTAPLALSSQRVQVLVGAMADNVVSAAAFAQAAADKVWGTAARALTDKAGFGLADGAVTAAKIADGAMTAGKFASGAFNAVWAVGTRTLTAFGFNVTVATNQDKSGYSLATPPPTATQNADAILTRALSAVEGSAPFRSLAGAIAKLVNKVDISGSTLTVRKTNDTAAFGTQQITTDEAAKPIVAVDTD